MNDTKWTVVSLVFFISLCCAIFVDMMTDLLSAAATSTGLLDQHFITTSGCCRVLVDACLHYLANCLSLMIVYKSLLTPVLDFIWPWCLFIPIMCFVFWEFLEYFLFDIKNESQMWQSLLVFWIVFVGVDSYSNQPYVVE